MAEDSIEELIADMTGKSLAIFMKSEISEKEGPTFSRKSMGATLQVRSNQGEHTLGTENSLPIPVDLKLSTAKKSVASIQAVTNQPDLNGGRIQGTHNQKITLDEAVDSGNKTTTSEVALSWTVNGKAGESVRTKSSGDGKGERLLAKASTTRVSASYTTVSGSCTGVSTGVTGMVYSIDAASFNFTLMRVLTRGVEDCLTVNATKTGGANQEVKASVTGGGTGETKENLSGNVVGGSDNVN